MAFYFPMKREDYVFFPKKLGYGNHLECAFILFLSPVLPQKDNILIIQLASINSNTKYFYRFNNPLDTEKEQGPSRAAAAFSMLLQPCLVFQACFTFIPVAFCEVYSWKGAVQDFLQISVSVIC